MRMFIFIIASIIPLLLISAEFYEGENLITPYSLNTDDWEILKREEGPLKSMMWRSKDKGIADTYAVHVYLGVNHNSAVVREKQDAPGEKSCEMFESYELDPIPNKNYKSLMWRTVCEINSDFVAQILHLVIEGKGSTYHLQKIWRGETTDYEINKWIEIFRDVYVCDSRVENKQCPSGYEKVRDV